MFEECRVATRCQYKLSHLFFFSLLHSKPQEPSTPYNVPCLSSLHPIKILIFHAIFSPMICLYKITKKILSKQCVKSPFSPLEASSDHVKASSPCFSPSTFFPAHFGLFRVFFFSFASRIFRFSLLAFHFALRENFLYKNINE
jgi:hypothetical protein